MRYHYQHGIERGCSWPTFIARMLICDVIFIVVVLNLHSLYLNYQARHDDQLIRSWCHQVLCVRIDPATGIGTPAIEEPEPIKVQEI